MVSVRDSELGPSVPMIPPGINMDGDSSETIGPFKIEWSEPGELGIVVQPVAGEPSQGISLIFARGAMLTVPSCHLVPADPH